MAQVGVVNSAIVLVCIVGIGLSYYAYSVKKWKEQDANYLAMCDISEHMSCSNVFMSEYGTGFGLVKHILGEESALNQSNSAGGIIFYALVACLSAVNSKTIVTLQLGLCVISNVVSIYLAYALYVLRNFCLLCVTTYVLNLLNLILALIKLQMISGSSQGNKKKKKKTN